MTDVLIFCTLCQVGYASVGELPAMCPACGRYTKWTTMAPERVPVPGWDVNENDRRLLRSLRIGAE